MIYEKEFCTRLTKLFSRQAAQIVLSKTNAKQRLLAMIMLSAVNVKKC